VLASPERRYCDLGKHLWFGRRALHARPGREEKLSNLERLPEK
jgi:hypothetical protein